MSLPTRIAPDNISAVCRYLITKPTGSTIAEAKAILDKKHFDARKVSALKLWNIIEEEGDKVKVTERGRLFVRDEGAFREEVLREVIRETPAYAAVFERAEHRGEISVASTDVAAHWHEHYRVEVSDSDNILNEQAVCFLKIAEGANLGVLTIGRRGLPTRFDFDTDAVHEFTQFEEPRRNTDTETSDPFTKKDSEEKEQITDTAGAEVNSGNVSDDSINTAQPTRVFITHGKNHKILEQVKKLLEYGKYIPVIAMEHETSAKPVPEKIMDDMRACNAAVIHVGVEGVLYDEDGNEFPQINENVLIEIGAAMALYKGKFVLLVEEGVRLPSNLQGLYECRYEYEGDEFNLSTTLKLLEAFNEF